MRIGTFNQMHPNFSIKYSEERNMQDQHHRNSTIPGSGSGGGGDALLSHSPARLVSGTGATPRQGPDVIVLN